MSCEHFKVLHIDPDTLHSITEDLGWKCKILRKEESGDYLAKISK